MRMKQSFIRRDSIVYGLFFKAITSIYEIPKATKITEYGSASSISDEGLHGMGVTITGGEENGFLPIRTFYNYTGYVKKEELHLLPLLALKEWENSDLMVIDAFTADIQSMPKVQAVRLSILPKGSIVEVVDWRNDNIGWVKVRLVNGLCGYVKNQLLKEKEFSQKGLWEDTLPQNSNINIASFREKVILEAKKYCSIQYRWGGKTTLGIDCSGLTSMCYMFQGILIYRDAKIMRGFPIKEIPFHRMKKGDLLYFPGHIAMYIDSDRYIHATARAGSNGVVINSLNPNDPDYREDLAKSLYAVGSIFC